MDIGTLLKLNLFAKGINENTANYNQNTSIIKFQYLFYALCGHFVDWQLVISARNQNVGNPVLKKKGKLISTSIRTKKSK